MSRLKSQGCWTWYRHWQTHKIKLNYHNCLIAVCAHKALCTSFIAHYSLVEFVIAVIVIGCKITASQNMFSSFIQWCCCYSEEALWFSLKSQSLWRMCAEDWRLCLIIHHTGPTCNEEHVSTLSLGVCVHQGSYRAPIQSFWFPWQYWDLFT